jgi:hypothetical protein
MEMVELPNWTCGAGGVLGWLERRGNITVLNRCAHVKRTVTRSATVATVRDKVHRCAPYPLSESRFIPTAD